MHADYPWLMCRQEGDPPYTGLWSYGYWVNGGVWTTEEVWMESLA